ncbi:tRNA (5-methylaminomethyl-2-thiouridine)(34)-methyltransferase MnmD [Coralliovum pocilloporae]|uniref:tRNA (5-methylaminomethyl-2-thiouridine)(34)-methyltransferase MnmD n=1 Tax=Coralliovum pocilloporae TaxID=3066369 RepID=UPI0033076349
MTEDGNPVLRSEQFDDVYFSAEDGLAETRYVFLDGNHLPEAFGGTQHFIIFETGFGTGLNMLSAWALFEETARPDQRLDFISVEKYPLSRAQIRDALHHWQGAFGEKLSRLLALYPLRVPGPHKLYLTDKVTLTLWFSDVDDALASTDVPVDAWFLDGFAPKKNPDMWSDNLFQQMARLSHAETTYATFTAAGQVRRGLEEVGFSVDRLPGFGRKRHMIRGRFQKGKPRVMVTSPRSIAIIGGGLAGTALAWHACKRGASVSLYEAGPSLASGGSGGRLGMINPKLTARPSIESEYFTSAYANALRVLSDLPDVDFSMPGNHHLRLDAGKARKFDGYINNLGWHADHIHLEGEDLVFPDGGCVSPQKVCARLSEGADVHLNSRVEMLDELNEDLIILAVGHRVRDLFSNAPFVNPVRGQVSWIRPRNGRRRNLCFGGYLTPECSDGFHVLGSTFASGFDETDVREDDHLANLERYNTLVKPEVPLTRDDVTGGWAGVRAVCRDRMPLVGSLSGNRVLVSAAHASHGIMSSLMAADILMSQSFGEPVPARGRILAAIAPYRFW